LGNVESAFHTAARKIGLPCKRGQPRATPHSLRHTFAVRALETCPDDRDHITQHLLSLSTYLGHARVADTYWYLEATPELMRHIAEERSKNNLRKFIAGLEKRWDSIDQLSQIVFETFLSGANASSPESEHDHNSDRTPHHGLSPTALAP
jgi:hypothetical protein